MLERVFYVANAHPVPAGENADHVEAYGIEVRFAVGEVSFGEMAQGRLFAWCHGLERVSESGPPAQFHLDEDEGAPIAKYQIDLPTARPVVALDEPVAAPGQVAKREVLAPRPGGCVTQAPTPA